ncbi:MAG: YbjN domain-containing protein [Actinomycetes bacterium]
MTQDALPPASAQELDQIEDRIAQWLAEQLQQNPTVESVERDTDSGERRWMIRVSAEEKAMFSVWFHLRQRTLHVETYLMPAPEENKAQAYEYLLRRNLRFNGLSFAIGAEDAVFLVGQIPVQWVTEAELDRLFGSVYSYVEQSFRPAMRLGFSSRYEG